MKIALWLGQGTECNKFAISLNNPSNICHKNDRVRERERETERKRKREREREREGEKKESERASAMPNDMVTAGNMAPQVEFLSSVLPVL